MFNVIKKTDENYNEIKAAADSAETRFNYNLMTEAYNGIEVGELLTFPYPKNKLATIAAQLKRRGLTRDVDYKLVNVEGENEAGEAEDNAVLTRLSEKAGELIESERKPRGPLSEEQKAQRAQTRAANKAAAAPAKPAAKPTPGKPAPKPPVKKK